MVNLSDMDEQIPPVPPVPRRTRPGLFSRIWHTAVVAFDNLLDSSVRNVAIMWREFDLFFGALAFFVGLLGFDAGKFCDGNTADYLSCTRPTAYYYFDSIDIALVVLGAFFIMLWTLKRARR